MQVTELLPAGLTFVSATPSQGIYTSAKGVWIVGTVAPGAPQTLQIVASIGSEHFTELDYPRWGKVWLRTSSVRSVRELSKDELVNSSDDMGALVLFQHDPAPEDEHAGFLFFGMPAKLVARLLNVEAGEGKASLR